MEAEQIKQLRLLVESATPGPWIAGNDDDSDYTLVGPAAFDEIVTNPVVRLHSEINADYIAAANPKAITALLDELADTEKAYALLFAENARLRSELEPSMFWNWDDAETNHGSIDELLSDEYNNGCLEVGARFRIQRAAKLPDSYIEVTAIDDESGDATYIESDKAMGAK